MIGMTVCSGIGAPEVSAPWIDWRYQSEIEKFPSAVLKHRFPNAVNLGDMTKFKEWPDATVDVLCGGTPCQSFSVAGLRKGLDDPRGNLMLTYLAIAARYSPEWLVWENVPGVLSSNGGRDFGTFLWGLGELGYGFAYRVLDAQFVRTQQFPWAVPQRRRRVFVVGHLGDWRRAAAVLFDAESLRRDPPPRREAGQIAAPKISARPTGGGGLGTDFDCDGGLIAFGGNNTSGPIDVATACNAHRGRMDFESETLLAFSSKDYGADAMENVAPTLRAGGHHESHANAGVSPAIAIQERTVAFAQNSRNEVRLLNGDGAIAGALAAEPGMKQTTYVSTPYAVRRLMPIECERLQGFPDGWTQIPWRGKPSEDCPDGPRYKALGNSWAVNCGQLIFDRMREVVEMTRDNEEAGDG